LPDSQSAIEDLQSATVKPQTTNVKGDTGNRSYSKSHGASQSCRQNLLINIPKKIFALTTALSFFSISLSQTIPDSTIIADPYPELQYGNSSQIKKPRLWLVAGTHAAFWTGSYIALNKTWYADFPKEQFHFFNDFKEWKQMDKGGHVWTSYQLSRLSTAMWKWTGLSEKKSVWLGSASGLAYQSIIEIQAGYSAEWGFSWTDMAANITGVAAYAAQQLGWKEQRIQIKMSYYPYDYSPDLRTRRDQLFGKKPAERILKDYNAQTYWASINLKSFFRKSNLPAWLNISVGYGADGLLGGFENKWTDKDGNMITRSDVERKRQFYLAPDIDLTKIKTRSKFLRSLFFLVNMVKVPGPTISWDSKGTFKAFLLYF